MNAKKDTAIVCFAYKRPNHLKKCLSSISQNKKAKFLPLIVYVDGPKYSYEKGKILEVLDVIKSIKGFSSVIIRERKRNIGLYLSLTKGITEVFKEYNKYL